ncbi:unnamed protein product, partial [Gulo gulo]
MCSAVPGQAECWDHPPQPLRRGEPGLGMDTLCWGGSSRCWRPSQIQGSSRHKAVQGRAADMPRSSRTEMGFTQRRQAPCNPAPADLGWNAEPLTLNFFLSSPL